MKLLLKKMTFKISRMTDAIGFYVLNSSHDASQETSCDASWIFRREKQWRHYLNNIIFLNALFNKQSNIQNDFPGSIPK